MADEAENNLNLSHSKYTISHEAVYRLRVASGLDDKEYPNNKIIEALILWATAKLIEANIDPKNQEKKKSVAGMFDKLY